MAEFPNLSGFMNKLVGGREGGSARAAGKHAHSSICVNGVHTHTYTCLPTAHAIRDTRALAHDFHGPFPNGLRPNSGSWPRAWGSLIYDVSGMEFQKTYPSFKSRPAFLDWKIYF